MKSHLNSTFACPGQAGLPKPNMLSNVEAGPSMKTGPNRPVCIESVVVIGNANDLLSREKTNKKEEMEEEISQHAADFKMKAQIELN